MKSGAALLLVFATLIMVLVASSCTAPAAPSPTAAPAKPAAPAPAAGPTRAEMIAAVQAALEDFRLPTGTITFNRPEYMWQGKGEPVTAVITRSGDARSDLVESLQ